MKRFITMSVMIFVLQGVLLAQINKLQKPAAKPCTAELANIMFKGVDTTPSRGVAVNELMWDNGATIKVKFIHGGSPQLRSRVMQYAKEWEQHANIKFQFVADNTPATNIRVYLGKGCGHQSEIGMNCNHQKPTEPTLYLDSSDFVDVAYYIQDLKTGGPFYKKLVAKGVNFNTYTYTNLVNDVLNLPDITWNYNSMKGTTLHEFGHALGLLHEQSYPNAINWKKTDSVYNYYLDNNPTWTREIVDRNVFQVSHSFYTNGTMYDPKSIMHYSIEPWQTTDGYSLQPNNELSAGDKQLIGALYPKNQAVSDLLVPQVNVSNFTKLDIVKNDAKQGLSIFPSFDLKTNAKLAQAFFVARLIMVGDDGKDYYLKTQSGEYNWGGYIATKLQMNLLPNSNVRYNGGDLRNLELFLPFAQIPDIGNRAIKVEFFVALEDVKTGKLSRIMYYTSSTPMSLSK